MFSPPPSNICVFFLLLFLFPPNSPSYIFLFAPKGNIEAVDSEQKRAEIMQSDVIELSDLKRAEFLLHEAMDADEAGDVDGACEQYMEAVELCLKAVG